MAGQPGMRATALFQARVALWCTPRGLRSRLSCSRAVWKRSQDRVVDRLGRDVVGRAEPHQPAQAELELLGIETLGELLPGRGEGGQVTAGQELEACQPQGLAQETADIVPARSGAGRVPPGRCR